MNLHNFIVGEEYNRPALLDFFGSKQAQSGVIWGTRESGCVICTSGGRHGKKAGYFDEPLQDDIPPSNRRASILKIGRR